MTRFRSWIGMLGVLLLCTPASAAAVKADRYRGADELAARIDLLLDSAWKKAKITPALPADDAEWLRRVYLDLAGRIPSVTEARSFLADRRTDKRHRLVESLLAGQRYPTYFAAVWRDLLLPEVSSNLQVRLQAPAFERWLRNWLASEDGYDWIVRELLTASAVPGMARVVNGSPAAIFYSAKENKPEEVAGAASRVFLGVNIGCAQCHNHPFASWKKEQFWSFAAFFATVQNAQGRRRDEPRRPRLAANELAIPGTDKVVKAKYLDGKAPDLQAGSSGRQALVDWMTASDNPYFARAAVNRLWAHFLGAGLIEPLDEMVGAERTPKHPELLDELARAFAKQKYDLRWMIRAVTATKAYQLSSARSHATQDEPGQFSRMAVRGLSGEQLFDSLAQATGIREEAALQSRNPFANSVRNEFLTKFAAGNERSTDTQTSILQALTLMNGRLMAAATSVRRSEMLQGVVDAPFLDLSGKIEALYMAALSRKPTAAELTRLKRYVEKSSAESQPSRKKRGDPEAPRRTRDEREAAGRQRGQREDSGPNRADGQSEALADVFWALLDSAEFVVNH